MSHLKRPVLLLLAIFSSFGVGNGKPRTTLNIENFFLGTVKVSRNDAVQLCRERSMELVSIQDSEKNHAVFELLQDKDYSHPVWTSGNKNSDGSTWTWLNGEKFTYFNWGPGEPNSARGNESCLEVFKKQFDVLWNDQPCEDKRAYVCEKIQNKCDTKLVSVSVNKKMCSISTSEPSTPPKKFYLSTQKATRSQALKHCSDMFMQLAIIRNAEENRALYEVMKEKEVNAYWTAGNRKPNRQWEWLNDEPITYFNWRKGEPNASMNLGVCLEVFVSGDKVEWNDQNCSDQRFFVCEKEDPVVKIDVEGKLFMPDDSGSNQSKHNCTVVINTV
ncbi:uncharacterized protein [Leptinotarsa decemlineata]|uniref:uncharacterized protein n=1 Tax=Leptinotarsa decemlineata TaxID=7539 RepID=UPI003D304B5F